MHTNKFDWSVDYEQFFEDDNNKDLFVERLHEKCLQLFPELNEMLLDKLKSKKGDFYE